MMLHDNPFAVLGAAPGDSRVSLGEKAARAGSPAADEALRLLTQPESRLAAELAWFPKSRQETVQAFVDYADALAEGRAAVVPRVEGLGCALAEANALSALFSAWPTEDSELFVGLCRTIEMLLSRVGEGLSGIAVAAAIEGARPFLIETQALVSSAAYGNAQRSATGFDIRRLNMLLAVLEKRAGFKLAQKDVFLNIAGGIRVSDPAIDLSVIVSVLSSTYDQPVRPLTCMAGEVGLSGEIRSVTRINQRVSEAQRLGFRRIIIPQTNMKGLDATPTSIELVPVSKVQDALKQMFV